MTTRNQRRSNVIAGNRKAGDTVQCDRPPEVIARFIKLKNDIRDRNRHYDHMERIARFNAYWAKATDEN